MYSRISLSRMFDNFADRTSVLRNCFLVGFLTVLDVSRPRKLSQCLDNGLLSLQSLASYPASGIGY